MGKKGSPAGAKAASNGALDRKRWKRCATKKLHTLQLGVGALADDVARVQSGSGLEEQDPAFFLGDGAVFDPARDDDELAGLDPFMALAEADIVRAGVAQLSFAVLHAEAAFDDEEHFVFVVVVMPDEFGVGFDQLDH